MPLVTLSLHPCEYREDSGADIQYMGPKQSGTEGKIARVKSERMGLRGKIL